MSDNLAKPGDIPVITENGPGYLPQAEAVRAFQEGTARAPKDAGELAAIKAQHAQALKAEQYGGLGGAAKAFAVKAVDVTGLAKPLAVGWERMANGDEAANRLNENLKGLEEENQLASMGGTAASFLAPGALGKVGGALAKGESLAAKGAGLIGRTGEAAALPMKGLSALGRGVEQGAGKLLGEGALGTIGGKALGFGAETAAFGAQHELSNQLTEEALGNPALNAERIFSAAGHDFIYGAVLGGALGVGSVVGKKALGGVSNLLKGKGLSEAADEFAGQQAFRGFAGTNRTAVRRAERVGGAEALGKELLENGPKYNGGKAIATADDVIAASEKAVTEGVERLTGSVGKMDEALLKAGQKPKLYDALLESEAKALEKYKGVVGFEGEEKKVVEWFNSARRKLGLADDFGELLPGAQEKATSLNELWDIRKMADRRWTNDGNKLLPKEDAYKAVRDALEDSFSKRADLASGLAGESLSTEYRAAKQHFAKWRVINDVAEEQATRAQGRNLFGLTDRMSGIAGGAVGSAVGGPVGAVLGSGVGSLTSHLSDKYMPFLAARAARGLSKVLETAQVTKAAKLATDDAVRGILDAPKAVVRSLPASLELFGKSPEQRAVKIEKTVAALQDTAAQAQRIGDRTAALGTEAPKTANAIAAQAANVNAYLLSKAPKPILSSLSLTPWTQKPTYQDQEVAKFAQAMRVAADPNHVIHMAARGLVSRDDVAALKAMYPEAYQDARQTFMGMMFDPKHQPKINKLPLDKRLAIVTLFDIPTPLVDPGFVAAVQQGIKDQGSQAMPSESNTQPGRTSGDAKAARATSDAMRTDTERLDTYGSGPD